MRTAGSTLARFTLREVGLNCYKLYTQKRAKDRTYKIYGTYDEFNLKRLMSRLTRNGARNVRPVHDKWRGVNAGVRFEY